MSPLTHVPLPALPPERFRQVFPPDQRAALDQMIEDGRREFAGRAVWSISSTARGGGVAEMLHTLLAYARGAGIDSRWAVIEGDPAFFEITKRIHNNLHGDPGDEGDLGDAERELYEQTLFKNAADLSGLITPSDVVLLHDPQTAGLVEVVKNLGAKTVWRAHIGLDLPNDLARGAWNFLLPYVRPAHAYVFSRKAFAWEGLDEEKIWVIPPSIDAFAPKNQELDEETVASILRAAELVEDGRPEQAVFTRQDGTPGRVDRHVQLSEERHLRLGDRTVVQVSRWDRLKDPVGVLEGFASHVAPNTDAHLLLAGPDVDAVADDPEGRLELGRVRHAWGGLAPDVRERVHLASLPMDDLEENAAIVNALQRHADVVVQKSLAEGFGLTVAEAMWKGRPVVASRVGGIQDQIDDGESGMLVDPTDLAAFGQAVSGLLNDPERAEAMGKAARERVRDDFLVPRHLGQYLELVRSLTSDESGPGLSERLWSKLRA